MRILVVGSGGREHALAWKLAHNPSVERLYAAPGNPGIAELGTLVGIGVSDVSALAGFAESARIDLTVVGPEIPLRAGIADEFGSRGLKIFGPTQAASEIEWSKVFCRQFAVRHGIPMAAGECFDDPDLAAAYARSISPPVVVKADGLAAGKGVIICRDHEQAVAVIDGMMRGGLFGEAGRRVVIEECLTGRETGLLCLTDGEAISVLEPAQDYKRAFDGDVGTNTGGMGSYSPVPWLEEAVRERAVSEIVEPVVRGLDAEGRRYVGCVYTGLMITADGPVLIEVNARFGDPETQVLLPRISSDFAEAILACVEGNVRNYRIGWRREACVCIAIASDGYPGEYRTGTPIDGVKEASSLPDVHVFHAGTAVSGETLVSAGGRVLNVTALGPTVPDARQRAYEAVGRIRMEGMRFRSDIAEGINDSSARSAREAGLE